MSEGELARRAFAALRDMRACSSLEQLDLVAGPAFASLGLPYLAVARFFLTDRSSHVSAILGTFRSGWASRPVEGDQARLPRFMQRMLSSARPCTWRQMVAEEGPGNDAQHIWSGARECGLEDGLFTPFQWIDGSCAAVVLGGPMDVDHPSLRVAAEALSSFYAGEGRRLLNGTEPPTDAGAPTLSARQCECLAWACEGKSSTVIAAILGVSPETVNEHIAEACRKLGVRTRVQAAVELCRLGLIDIHPPSSGGARPLLRRQDGRIAVWNCVAVPEGP